MQPGKHDTYMHVPARAQAFKAGRRVHARVIGQRLMDGLAVCSLKGAVVQAGLVSYADFAPGSLVSGAVEAVEDFGMFVKLASGVKCGLDLPRWSTSLSHGLCIQHSEPAAFDFAVLTLSANDVSSKSRARSNLCASTRLCHAWPALAHSTLPHGGRRDVSPGLARRRALVPLAHMSESGSARGRSKFKEGQHVTGRVLEADAAARRITLSLKKGLCGDKLPPFAAWEVHAARHACTALAAFLAG